MYFDGPNPVLTPRERKGLAIEGQWSGTSLSTRDLPAPGADGMIRYVYGTVQASVVCAVLQICDVELQPGETIKGVDIGDSARWVVNVTAAGEPPNVTEHLILKPTDVGLTTSMVITTNRRVYHLLLRSHRTQTMVRVGWTYPEDLNKRIAEQRRQLDAQRIDPGLQRWREDDHPVVQGSPSKRSADSAGSPLRGQPVPKGRGGRRELPPPARSVHRRSSVRPRCPDRWGWWIADARHDRTRSPKVGR
jgi:type IV secretory pathway VirB9-like protein